MDLIFGNLFCCQHLLRIQMSVILNFFNTMDLYSGCASAPNQTDSDVTCSRSCDQGKITKKDWKVIRVEKNPFFKNKTNPPEFFVFLHPFFVFFKKKQVFILKKKQHGNPMLNCFVASYNNTVPFSELHNNNLLYLLWHSNLRVKTCTPSLFSRSVSGQFTPKWLGLVRKHSKERKATLT